MVSIVANNQPDGSVPQIVPLRNYGRRISAVLLICLGAIVLYSVANNPRFGWDVVLHFLTAEAILSGLMTTLWLTFTAIAIGLILGAVLAVMALSKNKVLAWFSSGYVWFFRGTPLLVQLIFFYNFSALYPEISIGFPLMTPFFAVDTNSIIGLQVAACLGLGLHEAAYMCEIVRAGIKSVDSGQRVAGQALGMSSWRILRRIVLPQAARTIIPPIGNQVIGMLKTTSLVSVIAMQDLLYSAQVIYSTNFQTIPLLMVACIWYLAVTTLLSIIQYFIEARFSRGH